jgi:hypothetical protein
MSNFDQDSTRPATVREVPTTMMRIRDRENPNGSSAKILCADSAVIHPRAYVREGAVIGEHVVVQAGAVVGRHATLCTSALVRERSLVGDNAIVGPGAVVGVESMMMGSRDRLKPTVLRPFTILKDRQRFSNSTTREDLHTLTRSRDDLGWSPQLLGRYHDRFNHRLKNLSYDRYDHYNRYGFDRYEGHGDLIIREAHWMSEEKKTYDPDLDPSFKFTPIRSWPVRSCWYNPFTGRILTQPTAMRGYHVAPVSEDPQGYRVWDDRSGNHGPSCCYDTARRIVEEDRSGDLIIREAHWMPEEKNEPDTRPTSGAGSPVTTDTKPTNLQLKPDMADTTKTAPVAHPVVNLEDVVPGARILLRVHPAPESNPSRFDLVEQTVVERSGDLFKIRSRAHPSGDWLLTSLVHRVLPARPSMTWRVTKTVLRLSWKAALLTLVLGAGAAASQFGLVAKLVSLLRGL